MSTSSAAWRLSSAASNVAARFRAAADLPFIAATRDALPWSFVALLVAFLLALPFVHTPGPFIGPGLGLRVSSALLPAFGIMGAALAPALGWQYAKRVSLPLAPAIAGPLAAYVAALPPLHGSFLDYLRLVGPSGLFLALGIAGAFALLTRVWRNAWAGAVSVVAIASILHFEHVSLTAAVETILKPLGTLGDTYFAFIVIVFIETALWTFGMHGPALLAAVVTPVYLTLQMQNTTAFQTHAALPHIVVVSLFLFVFPGGAGGTLPLAVLLALSRVRKLHMIGRVTIVPALFNINEPLIFGAPIVFNPYLIPPFLIVPLLLATTTYFSMLWGWVGRPAFYVPSSIPTLISTYVATLDPRAVVLALVNLAIATVVYFPFVRVYEAHYLQEHRESAS
jgi:cellobiose-specific phosphotransferase system component IIC